MGNCPPGEDYDAGLCYTKCREGFYGVGPVCYGTCEPRFKDIGLFCEKPGSYGRGAGHTSKNRCLTSKDRGAGTNGCEKYGALWYPVCDPSYYAFGCCVCSPRCQQGFRDTGIGCTKPTYGRGVGTIPSLLSTTTILIIVVVCIVLLVIIITVSTSGSGKRNPEPYYPYPQQYYPPT